MCLLFVVSQIYAAVIHEGAAHPSTCCEWEREGEGVMQLQDPLCEHVVTSITEVYVWDRLSKSPGGGKRHMWMDCAPPNQLQEIQGLLRSRACLL